MSVAMNPPAEKRATDAIGRQTLAPTFDAWADLMDWIGGFHGQPLWPAPARSDQAFGTRSELPGWGSWVFSLCVVRLPGRSSRKRPWVFPPSAPSDSAAHPC